MGLPLPPTPSKVLKVTLVYGVGGANQVRNNIHVAYTGTVATPTILGALAPLVGAQWATHCASLLNSGYTLAETVLTDVSQSPAIMGTDATVRAGTRAGGILPLGVSAMCNMTVARPYRGGKPRTFLPYGVAGDVSTNSAWGAAFTTALSTGWNGFVSNINGLSSGGTTIAQLVNVSYFNGFTNVPYGTPTKYRRVPVQRTPPLVENIASLVFPSRIGSVRKRNAL